MILHFKTSSISGTKNKILLLYCYIHVANIQSEIDNLQQYTKFRDDHIPPNSGRD
jgi:hypothetical protein